jgi:hypothetical protein
MLAIATTVLTRSRAAVEQRWRREGSLVPAVAGATVHNALMSTSTETPPHIQLEGPRAHYRLLPSGELGPATSADPAEAGCFAVFDWISKQVIWESRWDRFVHTPSGFCFDGRTMFICDLEGSSVFVVDLEDEPGRLLRRISHPYMNDIHGLRRTRRGLLVASSGTDVVLELDLEGRLVDEWWAAEHGYRDTPAGVLREAGRDREHRDRFYHTRIHTTHLNQAMFRDDDERLMLVVLFQQGQVIQVDRAAPGSTPVVVVDGLVRPHGLTRLPSGWAIASSAAAELVFLDDDFCRVGTVAVPHAGWLQDIALLSTGRILVNDVDNHRLLELAPPDWDVIDYLEYEPSWRMDEVAEVPSHLVAAFVSHRRSRTLSIGRPDA